MGKIRILSKKDKQINEYAKTLKEMKEVEKVIITADERKELQKVKLEAEKNRSVCGRYMQQEAA